MKLLLDAGADTYSKTTYLARSCAEKFRKFFFSFRNSNVILKVIWAFRLKVWKIVYLLDEYASTQKQPEPKGNNT